MIIRPWPASIQGRRNETHMIKHRSVWHETKLFQRSFMRFSSRNRAQMSYCPCICATFNGLNKCSKAFSWHTDRWGLRPLLTFTFAAECGLQRDISRCCSTCIQHVSNQPKSWHLSTAPESQKCLIGAPWWSSRFENIVNPNLFLNISYFSSFKIPNFYSTRLRFPFFRGGARNLYRLILRVGRAPYIKFREELGLSLSFPKWVSRFSCVASKVEHYIW